MGDSETANSKQQTDPVGHSESNLLVADIGGSNARLGIAYEGVLKNEMVLRCSGFESLESILQHYFQHSGQTVRNAVIAVAAEVRSDTIRFTNANWQFGVSELARLCRFDRVKILNDFSALALAIPCLRDDQLRKMTSGRQEEIAADPNANKGLIGAGTGLGVSGLIPVNDGWMPIQGEGGHVRYGPADQFERELLAEIAPEESYVSAESLLSGSGLLRLYEGICRMTGELPVFKTPGEVVSHGRDHSDRVCHETLDLYCGIFGDVAGDLALTLGATGGMFIGGGVVNHMPDFFCQSKNFRRRFENKGLKRGMVESIPTFLISDTNAALTGASVADQPAYKHIGISYPK